MGRWFGGGGPGWGGGGLSGPDPVAQQDRLAAAGRLRSAVALELASGKVWALLIAVQSARGTRRCNGTGHPEWVRCHGPRAGAASHHACGRKELLRCWADSETRHQGVKGPRHGLPATSSRVRTLGKTERRGRGLDFVARDNLADSLMPQDQWCSPYPHSAGPGSTGKGSRTHSGRTPAGDCWLSSAGHHSPGVMLIIHGAPPLERLSGWIPSRTTGGPPANLIRARANRCLRASSRAEGDSDGSKFIYY